MKSKSFIKNYVKYSQIYGIVFSRDTVLLLKHEAFCIRKLFICNYNLRTVFRMIACSLIRLADLKTQNVEERESIYV